MPSGGKPEDPGALKTFGFNNGVLTNLASIAPGNGARLWPAPSRLSSDASRGPSSRSSGRTSSMSIKLDAATGLAREPMFIKDTLSDPAARSPQGAGPIHVHPNGRFVYVTNRTFPASGARRAENRRRRREQRRGVRHRSSDRRAEAHPEYRRPRRAAAHLRHRSERPSAGRRQHHAASADGTLPAGITVMRIGDDGKLEFVRKYDVDTGNQQQFWSGMITLG